MIKSNIEWRIIRGAVSIFGLCLLLSAILLVSSVILRNAMRTEYQTHYNHFRQVSSNYLSVDVDEAIIKNQYPRFIELFENGVIGNEKRLNWVETLEKAAREAKIPEVSYQIRSRAGYTPDFSVATGGFEMYVTPMMLNLGLLHEIDLMRLLNELDEHAKGLYTVKSCSVKRDAQATEPSSEQANVSVNCELLWFSIAPRDGREIIL